MTNRTMFVVRVLAEVPDDESAVRLAEAIQERVSIHGAVQRCHAERYWKIPEQFEASIFLACESSATDVFASILNDLGDGWIHVQSSEQEKSAVWNYPEGSFFITTVRWANVECFPESA